MGIHRKYDLTPEAISSLNPNTYYSCDSFIVSCFDGYTDFETSFTDWDKALEFFNLKCSQLDDSDMTQISMIGLVFN